MEDGTASALKSSIYEASGKTGTAEYSSDKKKRHAWFTGYATDGERELAVAVIVEGAGSGSEYAVPIAGKYLTRISGNRGVSLVNRLKKWYAKCSFEKHTR